MLSIEKCPVPFKTLLHHYSVMEATYTDCYRSEVSARVSFPEFVFAFYTTSLFKLERIILERVIAKPSTDTEAGQLAKGSLQRFAAWQVEGRSENELLLCDFLGRTRSWLMTFPVHSKDGARTHLYFGSAVVPRRNPETGRLSLGFGYQALLGFHKIYSTLLLYSATLRVQHLGRSSYDKQDQFYR